MHVLLSCVCFRFKSMASCDKQEPLSKTQVQFWMGKVSEWSEASTASTQLDACRHLQKLKRFLQMVLEPLHLEVP